MKITQRHGRPAFTLIELMAVITIIIILAGLVVGGLGFVTERQAKEKARVQIALLSKAIEEYKLDMGIYPPTGNSPNGSFNSTSTVPTRDLYHALYYDGVIFAEETKDGGEVRDWTRRVGGGEIPKPTAIYLADLDPRTTSQGWVELPAGASKKDPLPPETITGIKDPWGNKYGYRSAIGAPVTGSPPSANNNTVNPDFDLWSVGKDAATNPSSRSDKVNNDDIRNF
ncbi:MAG: prepilin-type N-terminal cleavage/methylation domain-containing protein [Alphaproteobacteria bacterium]|nr:MAG: prepilin-type N-terminal cleavage/methylation domain-containing protein [Alphaproteobacteria bacterium]